MARILIVDDDTAFRDSLAETVEALGHEALQAAGGAQALALLARTRCDAVFLDHRMPGMDGLQTLAAMQAQLHRVPPVVVLTAFATGGNTIEAMRLGAFDHLAKPMGREAVREVLERALRHEPAGPASTPPAGADDELIGTSPAMRDLHKRLGRIAASGAPVLVVGETGTGKEMVARALHRHSERAAGPFVAVNCAAIPPDLLESELFGHVRGAFTGAVTDRPGCFRAADGGVLLLDEIGDMAAVVQAKILRALQEGEVTPLGGHRTVKVDVRVIAATHRDLAAEVRAGRFREDLRFRLEVLKIEVPPLRERLADILPLAEHFLRQAAGSEPPKTLSATAAQRLLRHAWPGNVRELRNLMARCQALAAHRVIGADDLELDEAADSGQAPSAEALRGHPGDWLDGDLPAAIERLERRMIERALSDAQGNRADAARRLGIHRQLLYRKLAQYGLG